MFLISMKLFVVIVMNAQQYIMELPSAFSGLGPKNFSLKKFIIFFPKRLALKKFLIFFQKSLQFSSKNPHIPGNGTFLCFRKRNFLIFPERYIQNPSIFRTRCIFRTLIYLEPWHIQNHGIFRTRGIFRTLSNIYDGMFCRNSSLALFFIFPEIELSSLSELKK